MTVYICSPYSGDIKTNTAKTREYCRFAVDEGQVPVAPHLMFPQFMDKEKERERTLPMDLILLEKCDELWVFGEIITNDMKAEIAFAKNKNNNSYNADGNSISDNSKLE